MCEIRYTADRANAVVIGTNESKRDISIFQ